MTNQRCRRTRRARCVPRGSAIVRESRSLRKWCSAIRYAHGQLTHETHARARVRAAADSSTSRIIDGIYESRIMAGEYHRPCGSNRGQGWRRPERPAEDVQRGGNGRARVGSVDLAPAAGGAAAAAARSDIFGREGQKVGPKESREDRVQLSDASGHRKAPGRGSITWLRERREQRAP